MIQLKDGVMLQVQVEVNANHIERQLKIWKIELSEMEKADIIPNLDKELEMIVDKTKDWWETIVRNEIHLQIKINDHYNVYAVTKFKRIFTTLKENTLYINAITEVPNGYYQLTIC